MTLEELKNLAEAAHDFDVTDWGQWSSDPDSPDLNFLRVATPARWLKLLEMIAVLKGDDVDIANGMCPCRDCCKKRAEDLERSL